MALHYNPTAAEYYWIETLLKKKRRGMIGPTGPKGDTGDQGPPGPDPGPINLIGVNYSDYLYWDDTTREWLVGDLTVHLGASAGQTGQGNFTVAVGSGAGTYNQQDYAVALGAGAGNKGQGHCTVAVGPAAGNTGQNDHAIAIGAAAGYSTQGIGAVAVGFCSGHDLQGVGAVALGFGAGHNGQHDYSVAIGQNSGSDNQNISAIAIGHSAGYSTQGQNAVAIGNEAAGYSQGPGAISVGSGAGSTGQSGCAIAIGAGAGHSNQGKCSVSLGAGAGMVDQGEYAIAIGCLAGHTGQTAKSIIINASGLEIPPSTVAGLYINPIRKDTYNSNTVFYNPTTSEVTHSDVVDVNIHDSLGKNLGSTGTSLFVYATNNNLALNSSVIAISDTLNTKGWGALSISPGQSISSAVIPVGNIQSRVLTIFGRMPSPVTITLQMMVPATAPPVFYDTQYSVITSGDFGYSLTAPFYGIRLKLSNTIGATGTAYAIYC